MLKLEDIQLSEDARFDAAIRFVLEHETEFHDGHEDDYEEVRAEHVSGDGGGWTKYGIDEASHPRDDVQNLTLEQAVAIYRRSYWDQNHCSDMAPGWGEFVFDVAVNNGRGKASKWLCAVFGIEIDPKVDPLFPEELIDATHEASRGQLGDALDMREAFFKSLAGNSRSQAKFLRGWLARNNDLRRFIAGLVVG